MELGEKAERPRGREPLALDIPFTGETMGLTSRIWAQGQHIKLKETFKPAPPPQDGRQASLDWLEEQSKKARENIPEAHRHGKQKRLTLEEYKALKAKENQLRASQE